jgi:hypothetical protein
MLWCRGGDSWWLHIVEAYPRWYWCLSFILSHVEIYILYLLEIDSSQDCCGLCNSRFYSVCCVSINKECFLVSFPGGGNWKLLKNDIFWFLPFQNGPLPFSKFDFVVAWLFREISSPYLLVKSQVSNKIMWRHRSYVVRWGGFLEELHEKARV